MIAPESKSADHDHSSICGLRFSRIRMRELLSRIERDMAKSRLSLSLAPVDLIVLAKADPNVRRALNCVDYLLADGMPVVWASRILGEPLPERIAGPDLFEQILERCSRQSYSVFFLGSDEDTVRLVRQRIGDRIRGIDHYCPAMQAQFSPEECERMCAKVNDAAPDFLFVIFGAPKQDLWIEANRERLNARVIVPIGAAFDWYAGRFWRVPGFLQRCGLEWLGRLVQDPRRLWKRYLRDLTFPLVLLRERFGGPSGEQPDEEPPS